MGRRRGSHNLKQRKKEGIRDHKQRKMGRITSRGRRRGSQVEEEEKDHRYRKTSPHTHTPSIVVSASDCGSGGLGFETHQSLPRAGSAMGVMGRLEPHSPASRRDASFRVLLSNYSSRACIVNTGITVTGSVVWPC